jgi:hypothetical protein
MPANESAAPWQIRATRLASMRNVDHILDALSKRTQHVFETALCAERHQRLTQRLERLYGALELARLFDDWRLALQIETHHRCRAARHRG